MMTLTALIIEDNTHDRELLSRTMERGWKMEGISLEILAVGTLAEGLAMASRANVTILDLGLPGSTVEEVIEAIPRFLPPVIVLTGYHDDSITLRCFTKGAKDVIIKGEQEALMLKIIEAVEEDLRRRRGRTHEGEKVHG